jgi:glutamate 5-kinase
MRSSGTIVVKIGSSCVFPQNSRISLSRLAGLAETIAELSKSWEKVVLVSSGAIALGRQHLGTTLVPQSIAEKQALSSVGQLYLMNLYKGFLEQLNLTVGQVLVSRSDFGDAVRNENILNTFENLFKFGVIPIVNENDTVATEEIKYGDNDELAALVAGFLDAEWLFILTNHEGVFMLSEDEPQIVRSIEKLEALQEIYSLIKPYGKYANLRSKIKAAEIAAHRRVKTAIVNGDLPVNILGILLGQEIGTKIEVQDIRYLYPKEFRLKYSSDPVGRLYINTGAAKAILERKTSLLPVGILRVEEKFPEQSVVAIYDESNQNIAKGVAKFSSDTINRMKGMRSDEIDTLFDRKGEVVNRDYMVFLD